MKQNLLNFTIERLTKHIKDIIHSKTYSIDNFNRLIKQNEELENDNRILTEKNKSQELIIIEKNIQINEFCINNLSNESVSNLNTFFNY